MLITSSSAVLGCLGSNGVGRSLGSIPHGTGSCVIETMGGSPDDDVTGGDGCGMILGIGGISHGRGMRSSDEGPTCLTGGSGIFSGVGDLFHGAGIIGVASLCGDGVSDWGRDMLTGSGVSSIGTGGSYCSMDEYSHRCDPQGTKGSGGVTT